jgi:hypothetical protein
MAARFAHRAGGDLLASLVALLAIALTPLLVTNEYWRGILIVTMYFALLASAWNLLAGYTGQFSLAPAAFGMIGAYTTGLLAYHYGVPPALGIPASIVVAGLVGLVLHFRGNLEFEREDDPSLRGLRLIWKALRGATPTLAPGALAQLGLLGLVWAHRHPALDARSADRAAGVPSSAGAPAVTTVTHPPSPQTARTIR